MIHPTLITPENWESITERIFHGVGMEIRETRSIQHGLRYVICGILVVGSILLYAIALITA